MIHPTGHNRKLIERNMPGIRIACLSTTVILRWAGFRQIASLKEGKAQMCSRLVEANWQFRAIHRLGAHEISGPDYYLV